MTDLVERLREQITSDHIRGCQGRCYSCDCGYDLVTQGLLEQAATALEAQEKELAALRGELTDTQQALVGINSDWNKAIARAETAERELDTMNNNHRVMAKLLADTGRERDQAREALKPFATYSVKKIEISDEFDYCVHFVCAVDDQPMFAHFRAARAITGKG